MSDPVLAARSRVANLTRSRASAEQLAEARRALAEAKLERAVQRALDAAPPLTAEQKQRIAAILGGAA